MFYISLVSLSEGAATAAGVVMSVAPDDDMGAETAGWYEWQWSMAAADGLSLYLDAVRDGKTGDGEQIRIICEHHEDWVVVDADDAELVSAKHKEPAFGAFTTINQLLGDGGLAHLFARWHALNELPYCRLVTTAGLSAGPAQDLEAACKDLRELRDSGQMLLFEGKNEQVIVKFAAELQRAFPKCLPDSWRSASSAGRAVPMGEHHEQVGRFLSMLHIAHGEPRQVHVDDLAPTRYCGPVLQQLGHDPLYSVPVWGAVMDLFRARMRAAGPTWRGGLPHTLACRPGKLPASVLAERELSGRIVTMADISVAVRKGIANRRGYLPLRPAPRLSRIGVKMSAGQCADNTIERAEQLRLDYQQYWRDRVSGDPVARREKDRLHRALLRISDEATTAVGWPGTQSSGADLWRELRDRVDAMPPGDWPEDLDAELRLGGICDLTAQCQVWFSDRFDVEARIADLKARTEPGS